MVLIYITFSLLGIGSPVCTIPAYNGLLTIARYNDAVSHSRFGQLHESAAITLPGTEVAPSGLIL